MNLLSPEPGLVIWTGITFLILTFVMAKFAWNPMLGAIKAREEKINLALQAAYKAHEELKAIEQTKVRLLTEAKQERDVMLREAREMKESIAAEARTAAQVETKRLLHLAHLQIEKEKSDAIVELKRQVAKLSVGIAEKLLLEELAMGDRQNRIIEQYLNESNLN